MEIKEYVSMRKLEIAKAIAALGRKPRLVIIQVNDSPASDAYIRGKLKDAAEVGAEALLEKLAPTTDQATLLKLIEKHNNDSSVDGLIVQLPLPKQISEDAVRLAINPKKDIDGFHPLSPCDPCTPKGIIAYLKEEGFPFRGKNAVVIGRSNIVGKPMGRLLTKNDCNVTTLHSKTTREDMEFYVGHADLIVVAVGHQAFLDHSFPLKEGCLCGRCRNQPRAKMANSMAIANRDFR
jgi:methylenetetrahydrofolate dehydrogenase (NADP+)/methenyltetrahydrofolate cyclohydrolase